jgi:hypothetical protein
MRYGFSIFPLPPQPSRPAFGLAYAAARKPLRFPEPGRGAGPRSKGQCG